MVLMSYIMGIQEKMIKCNLYLAHKKNFLDFPEDQRVLEIAADATLISLYAEKNLARYIGVQPNDQSVGSIQKAISQCNSFTDNYEIHNIGFEDFKLTEEVDVVTCAGLVYHLHSPLYLLETLANYEAKIVYIETAISIPPKKITDTSRLIKMNCTIDKDYPINARGYRQTKFKRTLPWQACIGSTEIVYAMQVLGYDLENYVSIHNEEFHISKQNIIDLKFVRRDD